MKRPLSASPTGNEHCQEINHPIKETHHSSNQTKTMLTRPLTANGADNQTRLSSQCSRVCVDRSHKYSSTSISISREARWPIVYPLRLMVMSAMLLPVFRILPSLCNNNYYFNHIHLGPIID